MAPSTRMRAEPSPCLSNASVVPSFDLSVVILVSSNQRVCLLDDGWAGLVAKAGNNDDPAPNRLLGGRLGFGQTRLLVDADDIARGVAERCDNLRRIWVDVADNLAACRLDRFNCLGGARNHDVNHQSGLGRNRPPEDPRPAHLVDAVVESRRAVASLSNLPSEGTLVELGRLLNVSGGNLDVADLSGSVRGWLNRWTHHADATRAAFRGRCS